MIKLGIFLLPDAKLKKLINNNKIQIIRIFGNQKYVSHLPHCTICVLDVSEKIMKVKKLKRAINIKQKKKLLVKKPDVFYNDPITGGDTIFYKINKIKCLSRKRLPIQKLEKVYFFKINEDKHTLLWSNKII
jgi:hypothetical protein